jgi:hypothetical protein
MLRHVDVLDRKQRTRRRPLADVGGHAAGDHVQVRLDAGLLGVEVPGRGPPQPHERLLDQLFGESVVAQLLDAEAEQPPFVPAVELDQRVAAVARGNLGNKICLLGYEPIRSAGYRHRQFPPPGFYDPCRTNGSRRSRTFLTERDQPRPIGHRPAQTS